MLTRKLVEGSTRSMVDGDGRSFADSGDHLQKGMEKFE
jgi:hypothetical protein